MSEKIVRTTCGYCSVGCNLDVTVVGGKPVKISQAKDYPVNQGKTCTKGYNFIKPCEAPDRALFPSMLDRATGIRRRVSWDEASAHFAQKFKAIQTQYGPDSVAFFSTGQIPFEEMAFLGSAAKFGFGFRHGDGNTRQCMATAAVSYKQSLGFDAPPFTYKDAEESDLMIFVGANPAIAHPILWQRIKASPRQPVVVVIDPRYTETAKEAAIHLAIRPKSDLSLLYGLARELSDMGRIDRVFVDAHTEGFEEFEKHLQNYSVERASRESEIPEETLREVARLIADKERVSFWWTMGVNQSHQGVRTAQAMMNICLMTGNIGRPGTGPNSITGQTNAMGSRLFSNTTSLLGGHYFDDPEHRAKISRILEIPESSIPMNAGMTYDQILSAIDDGKIKGLWVICTNPAHSWIDHNTFMERMKHLDFLVVQDMYDSTVTAQMADLLLPAAGSPEKSGTFINSERRLGIVQKVSEAPGEAKSDFEIVKTLVKAWGVADMFEKWSDPDAAFQILREVSRGQPCDISGIPDRYALLSAGGIQWPWSEADAARSLADFEAAPGNAHMPSAGLPAATPAPAGAPALPSATVSAVAGLPFGEAQQRRLFENGEFYHKNKKAKFLFSESREMPEEPDAEYPYFLLTGRGTMHQWHTQTRTGKVEILKKMYPADSYAEVSAADAERLGLSEGSRVRVSSRRGSVVVEAKIRDSVRPGYLFLPMHYIEGNFLTYPAFDEFSRQPSYKFGAVRIEKVS